MFMQVEGVVQSKELFTHWMLSRSTFLCRLAPPLPSPLPPFPRPDIVYELGLCGVRGEVREKRELLMGRKREGIWSEVLI